ncbi:DUF3857 domain-containing protein [Candidatus Tisiphia endosymbiont of Nedyus quadrimaculatus]|uniref:DUF3857 domain-containing protein n=1 Tax=Candidatus Tisiphia endosymbiont of Nedyus quadrimaculatus TaxID=3139332 RepID=UPI00345EFA29
MTYLKFCFRLILLVFLINYSAQGRWSNYEDAPVEIKLCNNNITINQDGTSEEITEMHAKILKESGRSQFSHYRLSYNNYSAQISILEAKTVYNGQEYVVSKDMIEDKPLASFGQGFDQLNQITISFPKVELGAEIYLKYKFVKTKVPVDNFYGTTLFYGTEGYLRADHTKINSKLPLNIKVNDPKGVLKVITDAESDFHSAEIILEKPVYNQLTNEPNNGVLNVKHTTWVSLSSLTKWQDLAKQLAPGYFKVINQPLPTIFMNIAESALDKNTDEEKINFVTSSLAEKIQYMGDWRTVSGQYFPRDLEKIATSQIGDCKDFSASTAVILQKLGFKVQPILVMRGITNFSNPNALPNIGNFNHVMLKIANKNGKIYWIDPTNFVSMAQGIFPDVAGKLALVLDIQQAGYTKIPEIAYQNSQAIIHNEFVIRNNIVDVHGQLDLKAEVAVNITGAGLYESNEQLRDFTFHMLTGVYLDEEEKKFLELPDLTSRIVKDITIKYAYQQKNQIFKTNKGAGLRLRLYGMEDITNTAFDQVSDLFIGVPNTNKKHTIIKNIIIKDCKKLNFEIDTPWIYVNRSCKYQNKDTEFTDIISIRKSLITNEELKTPQYKNLKSNLENKFERAAIVIE